MKKSEEMYNMSINITNRKLNKQYQKLLKKIKKNAELGYVSLVIDNPPSFGIIKKLEEDGFDCHRKVIVLNNIAVLHDDRYCESNQYVISWRPKNE